MRYSFIRRSDATRLAANPLLVAAVISLMGVIVRLALLSVPGRLGGLTEYDDGVYFGAALKLVNGVFPYRDYVLVQPPGIALLLSPVALLAKLIGSDGGMSVARIVTVLVDGLNIFLVGKIVRSRGIWAVIAGCGFVAFYSQAIVSSATVLLEPYMNLFCLLGVYFALGDASENVSNRRLLLSGIFIGIAGSIKSWAIVPAIFLGLILLISLKSEKLRSITSYIGGIVLGFGAVTLPFILVDASGFFHDVISVQLARVPGQRVSVWTRLNELTGSAPLKWLFGHQREVTIFLSLAMVLVIVIVIKNAVSRRSTLGAFAVITAIGVTAVLFYPNDFYYHYPDFLAPYFAISLAVAAESVRSWRVPFLRSSEFRTPALGLIGSLCLLVFVIDFVFEINAAPAPVPSRLAQGVIPKGACVVSDEVSLLIESNRFYANSANCPVLIDSYGAALSLSGGLTIDGGASHSTVVDKFWLSEMKGAKYLWLSPQNQRRLGWSSGNLLYLKSHFVEVTSSRHLGKIYKKI